jgi:hypothetical protein
MRRGAVGAFAGVFLLLFAAGSATSASTPSHAKPRWRGTFATLPANAVIGGNLDVSMRSISCPSPGNCSAVGSYLRRPAKLYRMEGLLLTEKAGHWARGVEAVLPANAVSDPQVSLNSVSCASAGNCTAVGTYSDGSGPGGIYSEGVRADLLLTEKAGHWAAGIEARLPANAVPGALLSLNAVSCASAGNCTAVGTYYSGGVDSGLLLTEKAGHWARGAEAPLPSDAQTGRDVLLPAVSCSSDGRCSAVGTYNMNYGRSIGAGEGVLLTKRAGKWRAVKAVMPADGPGEGLILNSVSCASAGNCSAVGLYNINIDSSQGGGEGVLLSERAGKWQPGVTAMPPKNATTGYWKNYVGLTGISCGAPGDCVAIGEYYNDQLRGGSTLLAEKAGKWRRGVEAALPRDNYGSNSGALLQVSCASRGNCTVVGSYYGAAGPRGFLLTETAGSWARGVKSPLLALSVTSVSCAAPGNCGAAGGVSLSGETPPDPSTERVLLDSSTKWCVVPELQGMTLARARHSIESHGCWVGRIEHAQSPTIEAGHVISQIPQPGTHRVPWTKVNLTVSNGP